MDASLAKQYYEKAVRESGRVLVDDGAQFMGFGLVAA
jgi:hypothetical protein